MPSYSRKSIKCITPPSPQVLGNAAKMKMFNKNIDKVILAKSEGGKWSDVG